MGRRSQRCVLNTNHVAVFQKQLKKQRKLKKMRRNHRKKGAQSLGHLDKVEEEDRVDVREPQKVHGHGQGHEEMPMKPPWLESSYFQKGNFDQKTLHLSWHPKKDVIAAVGGSQLLLFQKL